MEIKVNLIIDGNYILYRNIFSLHKTKTLFGDLLTSLEVSIHNQIKKFPFEKIYLVSDTRSASWRKSIYNAYKEQRRRDEDIDWEFCFNTFDQFKQELKENNKRVVVLQEDGLEGDDFIHFITKRANKKGESNIIISSDGDISQLLDYRLNPSWINLQLKDDTYRPKLYVPQGYKLFLRELKNAEKDLFNLNDNDAFISYYNSLVDRTHIEEVDGEHKLFVKIVSGDTGDNIKSVLITENKSGLKRGIGEAGANKIWESFKLHYPNQIVFSEDKWIDNLIPYICEYKKIEFTSEVENTIKTNLEFNRKLVHFDIKHYPKNILEKAKAIL
jgi:5'-3' exonuclease